MVTPVKMLEEEEFVKMTPFIWEGRLGYENGPREFAHRTGEEEFPTFDGVREEWQHRTAMQATEMEAIPEGV